MHLALSHVSLALNFSCVGGCAGGTAWGGVAAAQWGQVKKRKLVLKKIILKVETSRFVYWLIDHWGDKPSFFYSETMENTIENYKILITKAGILTYLAPFPRRRSWPCRVNLCSFSNMYRRHVNLQSSVFQIWFLVDFYLRPVSMSGCMFRMRVRVQV